MSKAAKRKKAEKEGRFVPPGGKEPRYACPFPGCGKAFYKEKDVPNCCNTHRQFISDYGFCVQHVTIKPATTKGGLHVAGSQTEVNKYIEEFKKKGKGNG